MQLSLFMFVFLCFFVPPSSDVYPMLSVGTGEPCFRTVFLLLGPIFLVSCPFRDPRAHRRKHPHCWQQTPLLHGSIASTAEIVTVGAKRFRFAEVTCHPE